MISAIIQLFLWILLVFGILTLIIEWTPKVMMYFKNKGKNTQENKLRWQNEKQESIKRLENKTKE